MSRPNTDSRRAGTMVLSAAALGLIIAIAVPSAQQPPPGPAQGARPAAPATPGAPAAPAAPGAPAAPAAAPQKPLVPVVASTLAAKPVSTVRTSR